MPVRPLHRPAPERSWRRPTLALFLGLLVAVVLLGGCGGGSSSPSTGTGANRAGAPGGPNDGQRGRFRACLQAHGVTLPQRPAGSGPPQGAGGGLFGGAGSGRQARFNDPAFRRAAAACGLQPGRFGPRSAQFRARLGRFVTCVRQHGFRLPAPNTSGSGPVFDPAKVNRKDPKLLAAARPCQALIPSRRGPAGPGGGAGPPAGVNGGA